MSHSELSTIPSPLPAVCWLALALLVSACTPEPGPPDLTLVVVDTLRADRLGYEGYPRPTSPTLDRLAGESVVFTQARAVAPCTFPSVNALLTSRPGWEHLGQPFGHLGIPAGLPTLAEELRNGRYRTAAVSASPVVRRRPSAVNLAGGFGRGFDLFLDGCLWRDGRCVVERADELLRLLPSPFFLYLHLLDPHDPYAVPEGTATPRFAAPWDGEAAVAAGDPRPAADRLYTDGDAGLDPAALAHLSDRYDEEVAFADARLGDLLALLERRGALETGWLVVTADHGESFLEHGHLRHCRSLHDEELRVPLLVRPPGGTAGRRVERPVSLLDVAPTLLAAAGVGRRRMQPAGRDLLGDGGPGPPALAATTTHRALVVDDLKLIHDLESGHSRLYDLAADPREEHDLAARRPDDVERLLSLLDRRLRAVEGAGLEADGERLRRSDAAQRQLRALGYLQ